MTQASLQGGARRRVGGHRAVEGVGAAGDGVDAHDVDLGALGGGGSVRVGGDGTVRRRTNPPSTPKRRHHYYVFVLFGVATLTVIYYGITIYMKYPRATSVFDL